MTQPDTPETMSWYDRIKLTWWYQVLDICGRTLVAATVIGLLARVGGLSDRYSAALGIGAALLVLAVLFRKAIAEVLVEVERYLQKLLEGKVLLVLVSLLLVSFGFALLWLFSPYPLLLSPKRVVPSADVSVSLHSVDPTLFPAATGDFAIARISQSPSALKSDFDLNGELRNVKQTLEVTSFTSVEPLQNNEQGLLDAVRRGVRIRFLLSSPATANQCYLQLVGQTIQSSSLVRLNGDLNSSNQRLLNLSQKIAADPLLRSRGGDLQFRWWRGPVFYNMWLMDAGDQENALLRLKVYAHSSPSIWPSFTIHKGGSQIISNFLGEFNYRWDHADRSFDAPPGWPNSSPSWAHCKFADTRSSTKSPQSK